MRDELKVLKLTNGDEVIGFIQDGSTKDLGTEELTLSHMIFIKGPLRIIQQYDQTSQSHALFLTDWMPSGKSTVLPIQKAQIVTMDSPNIAVEEHYYEIMDKRIDTTPPVDPVEVEKQKQLQELEEYDFDDEDMT